jgi:hypothetical protein
LGTQVTGQRQRCNQELKKKFKDVTNHSNTNHYSIKPKKSQIHKNGTDLAQV